MNQQTQIVATIGPASASPEILDLIIPKITAARLNFSWGTHEQHAELIRKIREAATKINKKILIIQDLSGPRMQEEHGHQFDVCAVNVITEKDLSDLTFGLEQKVDWVAMSYVGCKEDITTLRDEIKKRGSNTPIIAKVERKVALEKLTEIIDITDAIMVARGDLGNEVPLEKIPFIERNIVEQCKVIGKPVIVATQMMLSMTASPTPTRAEVTDVAFAVISGADAVMLSEESASGKYPAEAVAMMEKIIIEATKHIENSKINNL